jgi:transglutaminase-like putative cysteine protease
MILEIRHTACYRYQAPVWFEPLTLRLKPRCDSAQRLLEFRLSVDPTPDYISDCVDLDGNTSQCLWFSGRHGSLRFETESRVEIRRTNPFGFLLRDARFLHVPFEYPASQRSILAPYMERSEPPSEVDGLTRLLLEETAGLTLDFMPALTERIHRSCSTEYRADGKPRAAQETLQAARGACRDLAVLWMDACRAAGLAARFVSGYKLDEGADEDTVHHLHAWGEVYLPGGGWRGFDPSTGVAVAERHVAVAAGAIPELAAPSSGTYRGDAETISLDTQVLVQDITRQSQGAGR